MSFSIDQKVYVDDKTDGKRYPCKVIEVSDEHKEVKIHFINWSNKYEETLPMDSDRIHLDENDLDTSESFESVDDIDQGPIGLAIGKILRSVNVDCRQVVSTYDIRLPEYENTKNFQKFKVPSLENCANELKIKITKEDGKKLYKKGALIRKILLKIKAHLPQQCAECNETFTVNLDTSPLFSCFKCLSPSHDCEKLMKCHVAIPSAHPRGLVWMC